MQMKACSDWQTKLWRLRLLRGKDTLHNMFLMPSDLRWTEAGESHLQPSQRIPLQRDPPPYFLPVLPWPASLIPSSSMQGSLTQGLGGKVQTLWSCTHRAEATMVTQEFTRILEFTQEFSKGFSQKGRQSCNQATGSITPPAMHCHKQMGLLIYSSGTGFRSVLRHFSVGVCRAPVDTVQETLPNPIFTSTATTRANTLCWEGRDKIPKASRR